MNILAVDDERLALNMLENAIREVVPTNNLSCFISPSDALDYARKNIIDVAFLDINMGEMSGLILAKQLKEIYGKTNIIFVTSYSQYANNAFGLRASGYVMKPIDPQHVLDELNHLRNPIVHQPERVRIQCFGSFAVFVNGTPLLFSRTKPKELLAFLVHKRGASASTSEIASVLWEDKEYNNSLKSNTQNVIAQLMKTLRENHIEDIIQKSWNSMAINVNKVSCDYYEALNGNVDSLNAYTGEYISEYSWAEFAIGDIENKLRANNTAGY